MSSYSVLHKLVLFVALVAITGCSSSQLKVESDPPGADVFVRAQGQSPRKIGQTPVTIEEAALKTEANTLFQFSVEKDGYLPQSVVLPSSVASSRSNLFISLKTKDKDSAASPSSNPITMVNDDQLEKLASGVAHAQQMIKMRQLEDAENTLNVLIVSYPRVSVLYDLLGNVHYLKHSVDQALSAYKKSNALQANDETGRMIKKLEDISGTRLPANAK